MCGAGDSIHNSQFIIHNWVSLRSIEADAFPVRRFRCAQPPVITIASLSRASHDVRATKPKRATRGKGNVRAGGLIPVK